MSAIYKINASGLLPEEKNDLKALIGSNSEIKNQIMEDDEINDALLRKYLQGSPWYSFSFLFFNFFKLYDLFYENLLLMLAIADCITII